MLILVTVQMGLGTLAEIESLAPTATRSGPLIHLRVNFFGIGAAAACLSLVLLGALVENSDGRFSVSGGLN